MSVASRILKQSYGVLRQQNGPALKVFPSYVARRFFAGPVKSNPSQPAQKPDPKTSPLDQKPNVSHATPKTQVPPYAQGTVPHKSIPPQADQKIPPSTPQKVPPPQQKPQTPTVTPPQKVSAPVQQKPQTPTSSTTSPKQVPQTSPQQAAVAQKVAPQITPPQKATAPPPGPPPSSGSKTVNPRVSDTRKNLVYMAAATVGLASGIFYWQYTSRKPDGPAEVPRLVAPKDNVATEEKSGSIDSAKPASVPGNQAAQNVVAEESSSGQDSKSTANIPEETLASHDNPKEESSSGNMQGSPEKNQPKSTVSGEGEEAVKLHVRLSEPSTLIIESSPEAERLATEEALPSETLKVVVKPDDASNNIADTVLLQKGHEANVEIHQQQEPTDSMDIVAAIHAAEQRQAEIDAALYKEQLQKAEEKHQHALRAAQLESAKMAAQLHRVEKDMFKEVIKHAEELKMRQQEADQILQERLKAQAETARRRLEEAELAAKAATITTVAEERAVFIKDIGNLKLHMELMNAALQAKSDEAREGHTVNKLSLGTFALEKALETGAPTANDVSYILTTAGGDPLVEVALNALPKQVMEIGTLTPSELDRLLEDSKSTLKQLALIPAEGGGVLSHVLAGVASTLKVSQKVSTEGDGVETIICAVENHVKNGNLKDAADVLENGLSGTSAEKLAAEWAKHARNRAVLEQVCSLLRAHAAAIALGQS